VNFTLRPLYSGETLPVAIAQKAGWVPQHVWTVLRRQKSLVPAGWILSLSPSRYTFHYTQYATPAPPRLSLCHINSIPVLYVLSHYHLTRKYSEFWLLKELLPGSPTSPNAFVTILRSKLKLISLLLLKQFSGARIKTHPHIL